MTKTRKRGVLLDPNKVKLAASKLNVNSCTALKKHYFDCYKDAKQDTKIIDNAWRASANIEIDNAQKIAKCLGIDDYKTLLQDDLSAPTCAWQKLIFDEDYQDKFVNFIDHSKSDLNLVQFSQDDHEDLPKIALSTKWHLELRGNDGNLVFIIIRSEDKFFQLAPIEMCSNKFNGKKMRYPQNTSLTFNKKDGTGWRQLIVVRAKHIKHPTKNDHSSYICTIEDLNLFALNNNIPKNAIAVDMYEFMLIES